MATKKKALKKSKLRHAEYYDFQKIQDKLYAESMDGKMFTKLVEIITLPENIKLAYRNIKKNKGSKTAGTDGKTIQHLEKLSEEKLVVLVQRKFSWYVPQSVRRVEIPKDNGKTRPLGIFQQRGHIGGIPARDFKVIDILALFPKACYDVYGKG